MPEDRECKTSGQQVQEFFEAHPDADWQLKHLEYDASNSEDKRFRKSSRLGSGLVDVLPYDSTVTRGPRLAQNLLYPPMFHKTGCMSDLLFSHLYLWLMD